MLARIASKRTSNSLLPLAKTGFRGERSQHSSSDNSSGGTSWVKIGAIGTVAIGSAVGGTVYFASTNEENREKVEKNVPYSNLLLNTILGPSTAQSYEVKSTVPKKKPQQVAESVENLKTVVTAPVFKPEKETAVKPDLPSIQKSKKDATTIVPVDVHKPVIEKSAPTPDAVVVANERLKERLPAAIKDAESKVKTAREAKIKTIQAINDHSKALKQAVDDGQSANWTAVSDALTKMEKSTSNDIAEERDARNYIDNLRK
uniref:MICOS complex subunit MIC60 n=1 Tax=Acrobeloides nanus TaxID=290746 RepID=A0A914D476_9BILA